MSTWLSTSQGPTFSGHGHLPSNPDKSAFGESGGDGFQPVPLEKSVLLPEDFADAKASDNQGESQSYPVNDPTLKEVAEFFEAAAAIDGGGIEPALCPPPEVAVGGEKKLPEPQQQQQQQLPPPSPQQQQHQPQPPPPPPPLQPPPQQQQQQQQQPQPPPPQQQQQQQQPPLGFASSDLDMFGVASGKASSRISVAQIGDRVTNQIWNACTGQWMPQARDEGALPSMEAPSKLSEIMAVLDQENDVATLSRRAQYGLETKNKLVDRLREEVDLFMMTPECLPAVGHLSALREQLDFHYHRITQHVVSFADSRLGVLPTGGPPVQAWCIRTWAQCVGYELICELIDSLVKEVEQLRSDCVCREHESRRRQALKSHEMRRSMGAPIRGGGKPGPRGYHLDRPHASPHVKRSEGPPGPPGGGRYFDGEGRPSSGDLRWSGDSRDDPVFTRGGREGYQPMMRGKEDEAAFVGNVRGRPKRAAAMVSRRLMSSSSFDDEDEEDDDEEEDDGLSGGGRKRTRYRSALPSSARNVLDQWLSQHWHDPYPTPEEKGFLAEQCKITVDQVNHWFINARVRRWRPTMEKAATKAKSSGSNQSFAALVKDCGDHNPFAKFLGPIDMEPAIGMPAIGGRHMEPAIGGRHMEPAIGGRPRGPPMGRLECDV